MASAEEGGNQPQRVLLVGGIKHGQYINLPVGQEQYEFTSMQTLQPPTGLRRWPESSTHIYRLDPPLSSAVKSKTLVFTHESIWNSPYGGSFNLWAVKDATDALEAANNDLKTAREQVITIKNAKFDVESQITTWQRKYEALLESHTNLGKQLKRVRKVLEGAAVNIASAVAHTGLDYESVFHRDEEV